LDHGKVIDGTCIAIRNLPSYETKLIKTGQYIPKEGRTWEGRINPIIELDYSKISNRKDEGTRWNAPTNIILKNEGAKITFGNLQKANSLEISVDNNDFYSVSFYSKNNMIYETSLTARNIRGGGLVIHTLSLPKDIEFDSIIVKPIRGDNAYSIGHLRVISK